MHSVMSHSFSQVPSANIQRSSFNRTHAHKTTFNAGYLVPFYLDEVLPGDTFNLNATLFARMATPRFPIMDNLFMDTFYFFVPNRLVWDNWQKFMGERENPDDSIDYLIPKLVFTGDHSVTSDDLKLLDYFGIGGVDNKLFSGQGINALPIRAYNLIWNEWFRDQNLQERRVVNKGNGPDIEGTPTDLARRGKRHDYFTSALPWPQKGPGVEIPIAGGTVPVTTSPQRLVFGPQPGQLQFADTLSGALSSIDNALGLSTMGYVAPASPAPTQVGSGRYYPTNLKVDLDTNAISATINSLRQAFQLQKMYERDARGGTRYVEILRSHFGVISPDARLQRPEYLGGHSQPILINPVQQTSSTNEISPQGNLSAFAVTSQHSGFSKSFTEHGYVIGLVSVRADLTYSQGINKLWLRNTRYDFYWPSFAHLGEQVVYDVEIYNDGVASMNRAFGYQERYAEYRYKPSLVTGAFRSGYPGGSLNVWHLSQVFGNRPVLGNEFIQEDPPIGRVVAVPSQPHFIMDSYIRLRCARPMPVYSVPGLIDHF